MRGTVTRLLALMGLLLATSATPARAAGPPVFADGDGLTVTDVEQRSPRLFAVTLRSTDLTAPARVWILLPAGYADDPHRRYPVLYLFHGTSGYASDWLEKGDVERTTAGRPLIVVMPDAGINGDGGGLFTDWYNNGAYGVPRWESYHVGQLVPWIDRSLRTRADRGGRALAGLSQGGFGAMSYAARHPDAFGAVLAFSAPLDFAANPARSAPFNVPLVALVETVLDQVPAGSTLGPWETNQINWRAHDPASLVGNLRSTRLWVRTGDGRRGPLDRRPDPVASTIEAGAHRLTELFMEEAHAQGVPVAYADYGPGTHSWPYWRRDLRVTIGPLMRAFDRPVPAPRAVDFRSDATAFTQWGWTVRMDRVAREFARLDGATPRGFTLRGSGTGTVTTPAAYVPGATLRVRLEGAEAGTRTVAADGTGRLTVAIGLGPSNRQQQHTPGARTVVRTTRASITQVP